MQRPTDKDTQALRTRELGTTTRGQLRPQRQSPGVWVLVGLPEVAGGEPGWRVEGGAVAGGATGRAGGGGRAEGPSGLAAGVSEILWAPRHHGPS